MRNAIARHQRYLFAAIGIALLSVGSYLGKAVIVGLHFVSGRSVRELVRVRNWLARMPACAMSLSGNDCLGCTVEH